MNYKSLMKVITSGQIQFWDTLWESISWKQLHYW